VSINMLAVGSDAPRANTVTLIGEELFVPAAPYEPRPMIMLPLILKR
jgi:hypothetical protein